MAKDPIIEKIKIQISKADLEQAIGDLEAFITRSQILQKEYYEEFILFKARFSSLQKDSRSGQMTQDVLHARKNELSANLLALVEEVGKYAIKISKVTNKNSNLVSPGKQDITKSQSSQPSEITPMNAFEIRKKSYQYLSKIKELVPFVEKQSKLLTVTQLARSENVKEARSQFEALGWVFQDWINDLKKFEDDRIDIRDLVGIKDLLDSLTLSWIESARKINQKEFASVDMLKRRCLEFCQKIDILSNLLPSKNEGP
ncbi:MAG: hypothetical protein AAF927_12950 [Bacteroidota bacterium]